MSGGVEVRGHRSLGETLVDAGLVSEQQLEKALRDQAQLSMRLGQVLSRAGVVKEEDIVKALSRRYGIARYRPDQFPIDVTLADLVPFEIARDHQLAPLQRTPRLLQIAMVDPCDIKATDLVQSLTDTETEPVVCTERELNQLIRSIYGASSDLSKILQGNDALEYMAAAAEEPTARDDLQVNSLLDMARGAPVVRTLNWILSEAVRDAASDIHLSPERDSVALRFRVDGRLLDMPSPPRAMLAPLVSRIKILSGMDIAVTRIPQDGRFTVRVDKREINVRASVVPTTNGENAVLRLLDMSAMVYKLDALGLVKADHVALEELIRKPYGMILATGPTGSGKSTTLYAVLQELNEPDVNIITLEDPVEYRMERIRQLQLNPRAGMTFASGLRAVLRQDPDIIMVGEIRDAETASIAVRAAMTGHMVLSTVHTNDAAGAVTRLLDMGIEPFLVSSVLLVSIAQRLVRTVCPYCKVPYQPSSGALERWGLTEYPEATFMRGAGCSQCMSTGYRGRRGIFEILVIDDMIREMILQRRSSQEIKETAVAAGRLGLLRDDALRKALQGITTLEEAAAAVMV
jgi:type IV pilus assembly protein PilB